jgi:hypothetical protein
MTQEVVTLDNEFVFPTAPHKAQMNPNSIILFGKEKCGKTTALSQLEDCLIIDTERGSLKVEALAMQVPDNMGPVGKMNWLKKVARKLKEEGKPYKRIAIDTLSEVDQWAEWSGTYRYMNSVQGKSFNRVKDERGNPIKGGAFLDPTSDDYQSVHSLPDGHGYRWSRQEMMEIVDLFMDAAAECVIFVCHVQDKFIPLKDTTDAVIPKELALTGKIREILPRKVDAIGHVYNDKGVLKVNFTGTEEKVGGTRAKHLVGYNEKLDWSKIFI